MNEPTVPSTPPVPDSPPAKRRINFGRRRSDWLLPLLFLTIALVTAMWAYSSYLQRRDIEILKKGLEVQTGLRERQLKFYEKQEATKSAAPKSTVAPKPSSAPTRP